ncbi:MAG TPA: FKBP-type peptidyl-prolyl cis-trans isomerase, partial [Anaeromyxobacteraceae bacterium]|nr:FKBP-type peptidyl-prolyl cis-trans isomerase [Anaeromyxobacteraceae bacterium]
MKIANGTVVSLDYRLHLGDGKVIDASEPGEPLTYLHGEGQIVPGLERELNGLGVGDERKVVVSPADGYGERNPNGLQPVDRKAFPDDVELKVGL